MINIYYSETLEKVQLEWSIFKGSSGIKEDFRGAKVCLWLIGCYADGGDNKIPLECTAENGVIKAVIPNGLAVGVYGAKVIWEKDARYKRVESEIHNLFAVTDFEGDATKYIGNTMTIRVRSTSATYGYDGLDAYQLSVLKGKTLLSEEEWLDRLNGAAELEDPDITVTSVEDFDYDGEEHDALTCDTEGVYFAVGSDEVEGLDADNYEEDGSTTVPKLKDAGEYTIYWYYPQNSTYKAKSGSVTVTVNRIAQSVTVNAKSGLTFVNNNTGQVAVECEKAGVYYCVGTELTESNYATAGRTAMPQVLYAGTYNVYWYCPADSGHNAASGSVEVVVAKKIIAYPTLSASEFTYNGSAQSPTYDLGDYFEVENVPATGYAASATNAGTYSIKFKLKSVYANNSNYQTSGSDTKSWKINTLGVAITKNASPTYDGSVKGAPFTFDANLVSMTGDTSATDVSTSNYTVSFARKDENHHLIYNGVVVGVSQNNVTWNIAKQVIVITSDPASITCYKGDSVNVPTVTLKKMDGGVVSASSIGATVKLYKNGTSEITGNTCTFDASGGIRVSVTFDSNNYSASDVNVTVTANDAPIYFGAVTTADRSTLWNANESTIEELASSILYSTSNNVSYINSQDLGGENKPCGMIIAKSSKTIDVDMWLKDDKTTDDSSHKYSVTSSKSIGTWKLYYYNLGSATSGIYFNKN